MLGKKRRVFILFLLLLFLMPLSASLKLGTALTPAFLLDGYPLLKPGESDVYSPANDFLDDVSMENTWETLQDSLLRYERRQSLASVFLEVENKPFSLAILVDIRGELYNFTSEKVWSNIPYAGSTKYAVTNAQYPSVAYAEYLSPEFYASIGRRLFLLGPEEYSFILSPSQPYLDYASFGLNYIDGRYTLCYKFFAFSSSNVVFNPGKTGSDVEKTIFVHKLSYERSNFIAGFSELNCVYDTQPSLVDFTPFVLWHNQYQEEHSNVMIELSLEGRIKSLRLWALYAQDDICLGNESNNLKPTALGFACGFDWHILEGEAFTSPLRNSLSYMMRENTLRKDGGLHLEGSFYWATNWLYNRRSDDGSSKFTSDRYGRIMLPYRYYSSNGGFVDKADSFYLGFPYGPGTMLGKLSLSYENEAFRVDAYGSLLVRGDITIDTPVDKSSKERWLYLEGEIIRVWTAGLDGQWIPFPEWQRFSLILSSALSFDNRGRFYPLLSFTAGLSL